MPDFWRSSGFHLLRRDAATEGWLAVTDDFLRAYLARWKAEVGVFFDGVSGDSTDDELAAVAPRHPVFRLEPADGAG